jgi:hypothetical protein
MSKRFAGEEYEDVSQGERAIRERRQARTAKAARQRISLVAERKVVNGAVVNPPRKGRK